MKGFSHNSKRWRKKAHDTMRRDKYQCQYAKRYGRNEPAECVHHIYPVDEYPEYAYCSWNLISLSDKSHNMMHDRTTGRLTAIGIALQSKVEPERKRYDERMRRRMSRPHH